MAIGSRSRLLSTTCLARLARGEAKALHPDDTNVEQRDVDADASPPIDANAKQHKCKVTMEEEEEGERRWEMRQKDRRKRMRMMAALRWCHSTSTQSGQDPLSYVLRQVKVVVDSVLGEVGVTDGASYVGGEPDINADQVENMVAIREEV
ncbi:hypothetical protein BHE74_00020236 [Ensete ventricosum]|nr:hypothetical protein BHE74_00020236 [Ensete ventricosum]RZR98595.1 hypothetical protein BHM03_00027984 [Ensete ventricosum]